MKMNKHDFIDLELNYRVEKSRLRRLRSVDPRPGPVVEMDGRQQIVFCSNDYLGLSQHPLLKERAAAYIERYGAGATASRLICGNLSYFDAVEKKLAELKDAESALILNSGYQANVTLLPALTDKQSLILSDTLNHNSLIMGSLLSRCRVIRFNHNDLDHLEQLLKENKNGGYSRIVIATESVFSMDGHTSDIDRLVAMARDFDAILLVDEAHATGVLGPRGAGLCCGKGVDVIMGTFGKALGSFGAYIACSKKIREYMINCCSGLIFSTGLPPAVAGAVDAALDLVPGMDDVRTELHAKADRLRTGFRALGWSTGLSTTQIVPILVGSERDALELAGFLEKGGILASAIRPPTVPEGESRIRISVTALHTNDHLNRLMEVLRAWRIAAND